MAGYLATLGNGWWCSLAARAGGLLVPTIFIVGRGGRAIAMAIGPRDSASAPAPRSGVR